MNDWQGPTSQANKPKKSDKKQNNNDEFSTGPMQPVNTGSSSKSNTSGWGKGPMQPVNTGSSKGKSSKTDSGNVKQGGNGKKQGSSNGLTPPPGYDGPIPGQAPSLFDEGKPLAGQRPRSSQDDTSGFSSGPMAPATEYERTGSYSRGRSRFQTQRDDIDQLDTSPIVKQKLRDSDADKSVETMTNRDQTYYTLVGRGQSVDPGIKNPIDGKRLGGTVNKAWEQGGKQTTQFAAINLGVIPFVAGTTVAATGPAAAAGAAKLGLTGAAASAVKFGAGLGTSILAPSISKEIYKTSKIGSSDYKKMQDPTFQKAMDYAQKEYYTEIGEPSVDNVFQTIGSWIPGVKQTLQSSSIKENVTEYYINQGYSKKEAERMGELAYEMNWAEAAGDVTGTIGIESSSEILGRKLSSKFFTKLSGSNVNKITKSALLSLPLAGFVEGSAEYTKERIMENEPVKLWETHNVGPVTLPGGVIGSGAFGALFATSLGTPIARFSVTRPKTGKGLLTAARIMDPYEYPGDVVGGAIASGRFKSKVMGFTPSTMNINPNAQASNTADSISKDIMFGRGQSGPLGSGGPVIDITPNKTGGVSVTDIVSGGSTPSKTSSIILSPTNVPSNVNAVINTPSNVPIPTDVPSNVPTPTNVPTPVITPMPNAITITDTTPTDVPVDVPTDVPSNVPTSFTTPAPVNTPVPVSVTTPTPRLPFFPVHGGGGRGSKGYGMPNLGKFYSFTEFKIPSLSNIFKTTEFNFTPKQKKSKKKKTRKKDPLKELLGDIKL